MTLNEWLNFGSKLRSICQNLQLCKLDQTQVVCYFQKWIVGITENNYPPNQQDFRWRPACSFKQNGQGMPVWNSEICVVVQWHWLWSQCEMPACWKTGCDWMCFLSFLTPSDLFSSFLLQYIHPTFSVCHQCFPCPSFWFCWSPLDCCDHSLWAYVVYSHLLLQHSCSVKCSLWCVYEPWRLNQA